MPPKHPPPHLVGGVDGHVAGKSKAREDADLELVKAPVVLQKLKGVDEGRRVVLQIGTS